jgi:hypothetical protein
MGRFEYEGGVSVGAVRIGDHANLNLGEVIVLGDKTFEWDDGGGVGAGNIAVIKGGNAAADITALKAAIDAAAIGGFSAGTLVETIIDSVDSATLRILGKEPGDRGNLAFTTTMADADNKIAATANKLSHGENAANKKFQSGAYIVTALDVAAGSILIPTGLTAPTRRQIDCWSATGLQKSLTTLFTLVGKNIKGDFDGATDPVAGDEIDWSVWS